MLRQLQRKRIRKLLQTPEPWKILILDTHTQQILSPLLRINELRKCNVIAHFLITKIRYPITDTPAVYFVSDASPILRDVSNNLYSSYYLHFCTSVSRKDLEALSYGLSERGSALHVRCVYDQFLDFVSLQDDSFSFEMARSYVEVDARRVVMSLMSVFVTLDEIPFIVTERVEGDLGEYSNHVIWDQASSSSKQEYNSRQSYTNNQAYTGSRENITLSNHESITDKQLNDRQYSDKQFTDKNHIDNNRINSGSRRGAQPITKICEGLCTKIQNTRILKKTLKRPLLIVVDRNHDIVSPVQHVWSYSALINDLLPFKSNKVTVGSKVFDLYPEDEMWSKNSNEYFPVVAESVERELLEYKKELALRSITEKSDKRLIQETLDRAPLLAKKNEAVNTHFSICMKMLEIIKKRNIDDFYRLERGSYSAEELLELSEKGSDEDIFRLALSLCKTRDVPQALLEERKIPAVMLSYFTERVSGHGNASGAKNTTLYSRVTTGIMGNVKRLLPVRETSPVSELVERVCGCIRQQDYSSLRVYDPCRASTLYANEVSQIVVFCSGGTTYAELKTLRLLSERLKIPIIYGGTEVLNATSFIDQIREVMKNK